MWIGNGSSPLPFPEGLVFLLLLLALVVVLDGRLIKCNPKYFRVLVRDYSSSPIITQEIRRR